MEGLYLLLGLVALFGIIIAIIVLYQDKKEERKKLEKTS